MTLRNSLISAAIAALGASAWAQGPAPADPLKKPAAPALTMPSSAQAAMPAAQKPGTPMAASTTKAPDKAAMKHEKHASKATHRKHKKAQPRQDMHKTMPEPARTS